MPIVQRPLADIADPSRIPTPPQIPGYVTYIAAESNIFGQYARTACWNTGTAGYSISRWRDMLKRAST